MTECTGTTTATATATTSGTNTTLECNHAYSTQRYMHIAQIYIAVILLILLLLLSMFVLPFFQSYLFQVSDPLKVNICHRDCWNRTFYLFFI